MLSQKQFFLIILCYTFGIHLSSSVDEFGSPFYKILRRVSKQNKIIVRINKARLEVKKSPLSDSSNNFVLPQDETWISVSYGIYPMRKSSGSAVSLTKFPYFNGTRKEYYYAMSHDQVTFLKNVEPIFACLLQVLVYDNLGSGSGWRISFQRLVEFYQLLADASLYIESNYRNSLFILNNINNVNDYCAKRGYNKR